MLKIGLTGGIGCGKSTVCEIFSQLGVPVIDTDRLAREAVMPGTACLGSIVAEFGTGILLPDGTLNRAALRKQVFEDTDKLVKLETITHPQIRKLLAQHLEHISAPYVIIAIPLLIEKHWDSDVDRILVVDCSEELQLTRASARDNSDANQIRHIMRMQVSREVRLESASDVLKNDTDIESLYQQVEQLHDQYSTLAAGY